MSLLLTLARKAMSLAVAETLRRSAMRWVRGELSLQDLYDRLWRGSARDSVSKRKLAEVEGALASESAREADKPSD